MMLRSCKCLVLIMVALVLAWSLAGAEAGVGKLRLTDLGGGQSTEVSANHQRSLSWTGGSADCTGLEFNALIQINRKGACTGSLIAPNKVLTAGHCCDPSVAERPSVVQVLVGACNLPGSLGTKGTDLRTVATGVYSNVKALVRNPSYDETNKATRRYDICVMTLGKSIPSITPIKIVDTYNVLPVDSQVLGGGWGQQSQTRDGNDVSNVTTLRSGHKSTVDCSNANYAENGQQYSFTASESGVPLYICYSVKPTGGAFKGDSGGPLVATDSSGASVLVANDILDTDRVGKFTDVYINLAVPSIRAFIDQQVAANNDLPTILSTISSDIGAEAPGGTPSVGGQDLTAAAGEVPDPDQFSSA